MARLFNAPLSFANESRALALLAACYACALSVDSGGSGGGLFATSAAADEALLSRPLLPPRLRVAVQYRLTRKRILAQQLEWVDALRKFAPVIHARVRRVC